MKLLLAEDDKDLSRALVAILKHNKYAVDVVYDGEEALEFLISEAYDGVILDIMMPKIDGITVLKNAREKGITAPILMLTAKSEIDDRVTGLDAGADDYLTKPFATKELLARIRAMTRRKDTAPQSVFTFGNVTLNPYTYELAVGENIYRLANREYQMMELMMTNPARLISTERFMEKIWGYNSEVEISVVWAYISYLRKKLAAIHANVEIKASRGVGYSLEQVE